MTERPPRVGREHSPKTTGMKMRVKRERFVGLSYLGLGCFMLGIAFIVALMDITDHRAFMDTIVVGYSWRGGGVSAIPGKYGASVLPALFGIICVWAGSRVLRKHN